MAELTASETTADSCCASEQQATCCEPSAKADCCGHDEGCDCDTAALDIRDRPRARCPAGPRRLKIIGVPLDTL